MSVVSVSRPVALYREEQWFGWWVYALLAVMVALGGLLVMWARTGVPGDGQAELQLGSRFPLILVVGLVLPPALIVGVLKMTTQVLPGRLEVWFGILPAYRYAVCLDLIKSAQAVTYRPVADCGGWGIRRSRQGHRVFNARGNRGVEILLHDGSKLLVGSQRAEELADLLSRSIRTAA